MLRTLWKVKNVYKVKRLIYIKLSEIRQGKGEKCAVCGKEYKEWFKVEGSKEGVKTVDEVVRR